MKLCLTPVLSMLMLCNACNAPNADVARPTPAAPNVAAKTTQTTLATLPVGVAVPPRVDAVTAPHVAATAPHVAATARPSTVTPSSGPLESALQVKRFVVTTGVADREPVASGEALPADGSAIYAFAELANPAGPSGNVRITFERKGGAERVGDVTLPVPGNATRYRTWAFTHFIRAPGVWDAVLWSESGAELGRASFEVKAS